MFLARSIPGIAPSGSHLSPDCKVQVAERQGFEPWRRFPAYTRSRRAPSTTRPPLRRVLLSPFGARHASADGTACQQHFEVTGAGNMPSVRCCVPSEGQGPVNSNKNGIKGLVTPQEFVPLDGLGRTFNEQGQDESGIRRTVREPETWIAPPRPLGSQRGRLGWQKRSPGQGSRCR